MKRTISLMVVFLASCLLVVPANAALVDRGAGMIYDTDLGITWLQDANYAQTSGSSSSGYMNYSEATTWVDQLSYAGYNDWRLPKALPVNPPNYNYSQSFNGTTDVGYNIRSANSELAYNYYVNLGNLGQYDEAGRMQSDFGVSNPGPFVNIQPVLYWSGNVANEPWNPGYVWGFSYWAGAQEVVNPGYSQGAWAVRDGDTGPSASVGNPFNTTMRLGRTVSFDYWWEMGQEPEGFNLDILFLDGGEWKSLFGWKFNLDGSSTDWLTASFMVPQELRGLETELRFQVFDFGADTDPTVFLRNIASSTAPVPEPATMLLLASGLVGLAGLRKKFKK